MKRDLLRSLIAWKARASRMPLLLRGARQVGKSYLVEHFAQTYFDDSVTINFEQDPHYVRCFTTLYPNEIIQKLSIETGKKIIPGKTLLFLDEIQECPNAIMSLRYFKEQMPNLHVIGAGFLLEFALQEKNFRMPVGRIEMIYLKPLSFREYLRAYDYTQLDQLISETTLNNPVPEVAHEKLLQYLKKYLALGGMPAVHANYLLNQDLLECQRIQTNLLNTYRRDFGKYAKLNKHHYLQEVFIQTPQLIGQQIKYVDISKEMRSREIKEAIDLLELAGVVSRVNCNSLSGIPLSSFVNPKKFKMLFVDVGLVNRSTRIDINLLLDSEILQANKGAIAEQFVGQELLAVLPDNEEPELYYWANDKLGSMAEVDYITQIDGQVIPIEVKAGKTGRLKSLHMLLAEKKLPLGLHISTQPLSQKNNILNLPLYLISEYQRLVSHSI